MKSLVLREGIKGWATAGPEYIDQMDEYDKDAWDKASLMPSQPHAE